MSGNAKSLLFAIHRLVAVGQVSRNKVSTVSAILARSRSVGDGYRSIHCGNPWSAALTASRTTLLPLRHQDTATRSLCSSKAGSPSYQDEDDYPPLPAYGSNTAPQSKEVHLIRARGLPWTCTPEDLLHFFSDCRVRNGVKGVHMTLNREGRPTGMAFVEMENEEDVDKALVKDRQYLGPRYVEVSEVTDYDAEVILKESLQVPAKDGVVRLRGLPFSSTQEDVRRFFSGLDIEDNGVTMVTNSRGRPSGEAYVQFASHDMAVEALQRHRELMGNRYIEVFPSQRRQIPSREWWTESGSAPASPPPVPRRDGPTQPQAGVRLSADPSLHQVHMRGLPFLVTGLDIVKFFSPLVLSKILIEYGRDGRPTGEADAFFACHQDAVHAMTRDKAYIQERYIELFLNSEIKDKVE